MSNMAAGFILGVLAALLVSWIVRRHRAPWLEAALASSADLPSGAPPVVVRAGHRTVLGFAWADGATWRVEGIDAESREPYRRQRPAERDALTWPAPGSAWRGASAPFVLDLGEEEGPSVITVRVDREQAASLGRTTSTRRLANTLREAAGGFSVRRSAEG